MSTQGLTLPANCNDTDCVDHSAPLLTVIIPVYNEVRSLQLIIERVKRASYSKQIIAVDDGSTDGTSQLLARLADPPHVEALFHGDNKGKGAAIRTALERAVGEFTIIQDADLEYDPEDFPCLMAPMLAGEADAVYGSRYLSGLNNFHGRRYFDYGVKVLNLAVHTIYGVTITDEATCYKLFPTHALRAMDLKCKAFEFCPEVTAKACRLGLRIMEVPIRYTPRSIADGKKIRLKDGVDALWTLWQYRNWTARLTNNVRRFAKPR